MKVLNSCYVYRHTRIDNGEVFYIGVGYKRQKSYQKYTREYARAFEKKWNRTQYWKNIVNKTDYIIDIIFECNDYEQIVEKEKELIKFYGRKDLGLGTLVNLNDGGGGAKGLRYTQEQKNKMSKRKKEAFKNGKLKSCFQPKKVYQYSLEGNFVKEWSSLKEAENKYGPGIGKNALGSSKSSKGYIWSYKSNSKVDEISNSKNTKSVIQLDIEGNTLKIWKNLKEIENNTNFRKPNIKNCIYEIAKSAYGFKWKYYDEQSR